MGGGGGDSAESETSRESPIIAFDPTALHRVLLHFTRIPLAFHSYSTPPPMHASPAPLHRLPKQPYTAIEYPGPVSHPAAILACASQDDINTCFNAPPASPAALELRFRGDAPGPPLRGYRIPSQKLLLKVARRRRRPTATAAAAEQGVFTAEMVGTVNHTVRFVCKLPAQSTQVSLVADENAMSIPAMADYQWTPDANGPTASLINSLKALDCTSGCLRNI